MSLDEQIDLFAWLDGQAEITYLAFPNLIEQLPDDVPIVTKNRLGTIPLLNGTRFPTPISHTPNARPPIQFSSPFLLPVLSSLHAPRTLATLLAPARSLTKVTVDIQTTLYGGLRPSALMAAFRGIKCLAIKFGECIDRRSVEKVLGAAGAVLGKVKAGLQPLESLEVDVKWSSEEELYKIVSGVLPRFQALRILRLHCLSHPNPEPHSGLVAFPLLDPSSSKLFDDETISEDHRVYVKSWVKHCPGLRVIKFSSGPEWYRDNN